VSHAPSPSARSWSSSSSSSLARRRFQAGLLAVTSPSTRASRRIATAISDSDSEPLSLSLSAFVSRRSARGRLIPQFEIRNSHLANNLGSSLPARYAVFPEKRRVPGRIWVAHLEIKNPVQDHRGNVCLQPDPDRLKTKILPHVLQEGLEIFGSLAPSHPRQGVMSLGGPRVRGARTPLSPAGPGRSARSQTTARRPPGSRLEPPALPAARPVA